jgi:menaquinol-cytochrome c reductase iron-sulfur subunit
MSDSDPKDPAGAPAEPAAAGGSAGEEPRRHFLKVVGIGGLGAGLATAVGAPAVAYVAHPLAHETVTGGDEFLPAGALTDFKPGTPVKVDLFADRRDAWNRLVGVKVGSAWVIHEDGKLRAYSTVCPHLGCAIDIEGDRFKCPCHRSAFSLKGEVEGGPSPRSLDELEVKVEDGAVAIRYQRFRQGVAQKELV